MLDCLIDGLLDTLKLLPYLFITFMLIELIEHKLNKKSNKLLKENKKYGVVLGSILGALPQCGFSAMASNLFSSRVITIGTLIAIFLSTSDEMLPIMISERVDILLLLKIIGFKILVGIIIGFIVDVIYKRKNEDLKENIHKLCEERHCHCNEKGIFISSIKHTLEIAFFILIANILINIIIFKIGEENISNLLLNKNILTYFISSLVGLIPNCAGHLLSGLLTGSGLGILLLFKTNKNIKENLSVLGIIYFVGVLIGIIVDIIL